MCWEKKTHLSKGLCGSEPYIAPELFEHKGSSSSFNRKPQYKPQHKPETKSNHHKSISTSSANSMFKDMTRSDPKSRAILSQDLPPQTSSPDPNSPIPSPAPQSPAHLQAMARQKIQNKNSKLTSPPEYDARQVDVWAAAVVFYCMQFQELPWRVAKNTDPSYNTYRSQYGFGTTESSTATPAPLNNLVPRECRNVIKHMLDPDPKTRWSIDEALQDKWMKSITVCKEGEVNDHAHTTAGLDIVKV